MTSDLLIVFKVYLISLLWQVIAWPYMRLLFPKMADRGWSLGRMFTTLAVSLVMWNLGHLGVRINTSESVLVISVLGLVISLILYKKTRHLRRDETKKAIKFIGLSEYLFLMGLILLALSRGFEPSIRSLEKFMDFGFVNRYLVSSTLPAEDMWFAGKAINYYSFGHYWSSILIRYMSVVPAIGYNLMLAMIFALSLSLSFSIGSSVFKGSESAKIIAGLISSLAVCLGGNSHTVWYLIRNQGLEKYWYADATRFIFNTIHEFPGYSFVVSDLHGHLLGLPVVLSFILVSWQWFEKKGRALEIIMGVLVGVMAMTNTWDVAVYGMFLGLMFLVRLIIKRDHFLDLFISGMIIVLSILVVVIPWAVRFDSISKGIAWVYERSPLWQLAVLWSGGVLAVILNQLAKQDFDERLFWLILGMSAIALLVIPEIVYAKDIYPSHPRANTMFKLTYQASIMFGLTIGNLVAKTVDALAKQNWVNLAVGTLGGFVFVSGMMFPVTAFGSYYGNFREYKGLNGEAWMGEILPEKYEVIKYLRLNRDEKPMIEAVGDSYTDFNAVSAFSGVPTVCGWRVHEWLWRGGYENVGKRDEWVKRFYEAKNMQELKEKIIEMNIGWIMLGRDERAKYNINEKLIISVGQVVVKSDDTYLIKVGP